MAAPVVQPPVVHAAPRSTVTWQRTWTVARTDLIQLIQARDFWLPMVLLGSLFFLVIPTILLLAINALGDVEVVQRVSETLDLLPEAAQEAIPQDVGSETKVSYALAVYLLAPVAVIVPLTISTAVGAATIVGERERGTGEFLAHSPADVKEIYGGKLIAAFIPGFVTALGGFGIYAVIVNLIVGPEIGGWFFPTGQWWVLMFLVLPPFLVITLSLVLRLSARVKSTAAAQQASGLVTLPLILIAYSQSTGTLFGAGSATLVLAAGAWIFAAISLLGNLRAVRRARLLGVADEQ